MLQVLLHHLPARHLIVVVTIQAHALVIIKNLVIIVPNLPSVLLTECKVFVLVTLVRMQIINIEPYLGQTQAKASIVSNNYFLLYIKRVILMAYGLLLGR